ncbi:hypothetical protein [Epilithonimonas sp. UC225_85]|uniref:hypothetical protein n=1 Tax=Epilithonimonas sp. UC225_85 TaxID=3350167 RepID=UPI0036D2DDBA
MRKSLFLVLISVISFSCSKNKPVLNNSDNLDAAPQITYDTTAIDSFGPGATSESVMAKINAVAIKREQDSLAAIAKAEQEKLDKEKAEKEAQKAKETKQEIKPETKPQAEQSSTKTENPVTTP